MLYNYLNVQQQQEQQQQQMQDVAMQAGSKVAGNVPPKSLGLALEEYQNHTDDIHWSLKPFPEQS